jgi:phosphatidylserine/phosphatidylglycerophosphate/cardiolipin synthase-like enzyme
MDARQLIGLKVLDEKAYFKEVTQKLRAAKKGERIALTVMSFDPRDRRVLELTRALIAAAKRGANVTLAVDAMSFMINTYTDIPSGPIFRHRPLLTCKMPYYREKIDLLEELRGAGGDYRVVNIPHSKFINPFAGRSHIKSTVIGNEVYIGGRNLNRSEQIDLMVRIRDATAATHMYELIQSACKHGTVSEAMQGRDHELALDGYTSLLIDSGVRGQSIIYDQALEFIDAADEWLVMTCQYFPNSTTARHLAAARERGVKVQLFYNHPAHHAHIHAVAHRLVAMRERARYHKELFALQGAKKQRRIHAKLIATEKGAMIGSHNYVTAGVRLGTAESAILRRDPAFAEQAVKVFERSLSAPTTAV